MIMLENSKSILVKRSDKMDIPFKAIISSEHELQQLIGLPSNTVANKVIDRMDEHCKTFIKKSPLLLLSSADREGRCDTSPRGDAPGFVYIMDDDYLVIPERPGNKRMDSIKNILDNNHIGLLFIIPGVEETLRVNGKAYIIKDKEILYTMEVNGKVPVIGIGVKVEECFLHCAKAFKRSMTWNPTHWPNTSELPPASKILADHVNLPGVTDEVVAKSLEESYTKRLY